eukprot:Gregarina_sp_Poly_1__7030@NODE_3832_length_864_cov_63_692597_g2469_i0_p2_GENE_NODE_3832_length_864_cov_63_692597_g2469_i0NODE_3832_length_864_cov_63_692597_g2469_i0_p2_ORF_typecomplete_len108_score11_42GT87/PF09594_10/0_0054DUF3413/PF11893_8/0_0097DUF2157/PF09925_9/0_019EptA_B_N/PF08019_12/0_025TMEM144/PF07857_12/0_022PsbN/PF02468_15/3_2PsbN/PF02468_15/15Proton_antipo_C/PF01010_19/0_062stn_TNFRSF12A/PF12191_8/0_11_NODE_3832_length_864_cov_63_692597_g2469_i0484807
MRRRDRLTAWEKRAYPWYEEPQFRLSPQNDYNSNSYSYGLMMGRAAVTIFGPTNIELQDTFAFMSISISVALVGILLGAWVYRRVRRRDRLHQYWFFLPVWLELIDE